MTLPSTILSRSGGIPLRALLLPALLLSLLPMVAGAQAHPLVGTWEVIYPIGFEIDGTTIVILSEARDRIS